MRVCGKNKRRPGGWTNLNAGGFLGPLDLAYEPSGKTMYLADFGAFFAIDSGPVGGFRCDPGACANGAAIYGGATPRSNYFITLEQAAGTSLIWAFNAINEGVQAESLKAPSPTRPFVARSKRPASTPVAGGR